MNESSDQVDIIVSIGGGSAANISGAVVLLFIARVTKKAEPSNVMNWNKMARERSGQYWNREQTILKRSGCATYFST